jgi:solute carrier family 25 oxoglutarate transporter 11
LISRGRVAFRRFHYERIHTAADTRTTMATAQQQKPLSKPVIFGTSGLGGVLGWAVVHPFNTLAVRMNLANMAEAAGPPKPFMNFTSELVKKEGIASLYAGLGAGCLRQVFYATARYGLFETFRDTLAKYRETDFAQRLLTASTAGGCAALISCPIEVCLVRMSNDASLPLEKRRNYGSVFDAIFRIWKEEGFSAFYRGSQPFVTRAMVVGATQVATFDQFKILFSPFLGGGLSNTFASSMSAGLVYSLITMPLETAKNRMAFQKPDASGVMPYRTTVQTVSTIAKAEGALTLWSGFLPYYGRCGGHTVTMFVFVDWLRKLYRSNQKE